MQPYDEGKYKSFCTLVRETYLEAGRDPDEMYPVWPGRTQRDYDEGLSWEASCEKHLRELRQELGLDPVVAALPRLRPVGQFFALETGEPFTAIEHSDFDLLNRWQHGEDITAILAQRAGAGFNMLRVWTLYDLQASNIGVFLDIDYARVPEFLRLCAQYGLYVEFTAYTSLERQEHWDSLVAACQGSTNVLLELVNEGDLPVNAIDFGRYAKPSGILTSHGSSGAEHNPIVPYWDYVTFHTNGASEEQRKVGHNAMELWSGPTLTNETSRFPDVGMWRGASLERQKQLAFDSAAGAALLCAGSCFHSVAGKVSALWDDATQAVATAWAAGARSVLCTCQSGQYRHRDDLEPAGVLRTYQRGDAAACIVPIRM